MKTIFTPVLRFFKVLSIQYLKPSIMRMTFSFFLIIAMLSNASIASAQTIRLATCKDALILHQADSIKQQLAKDGFQVLKENSMTMESEYEMPVIVPLTQGSWYQFVFIGDVTSKLYEVRMFDWNEKQVVYQKKMWGDVDGNVISYSYIPQFSEYHMIKPVQVNKDKSKRKNLCGYVMLLKKVKP